MGSYTDSYTFTSIGAVDLKVTDAYDSGDQFAVYDNGTFIGDTSTPTLGYNVGGDADAAYASPYFSHGLFVLGAGSHSIQFDPIQSPYGAGGAYFEAGSVVPEPLTMIPASIMSLLGLGYAWRRRRANVR